MQMLLHFFDVRAASVVFKLIAIRLSKHNYGSFANAVNLSNLHLGAKSIIICSYNAFEKINKQKALCLIEPVELS